MSEPVFAGLPRFDGAIVRPPGSWRQPLDEEAPHAAPKANVVPHKDETQSAAPAEAAGAAPRRGDADRDGAQILAARLDRIERETQAHAMQAVQAMTAKLFPELSRRFLAEEIVPQPAKTGSRLRSRDRDPGRGGAGG